MPMSHIALFEIISKYYMKCLYRYFTFENNLKSFIKLGKTILRRITQWYNHFHVLYCWEIYFLNNSNNPILTGNYIHLMHGTSSQYCALLYWDIWSTLRFKKMSFISVNSILPKNPSTLTRIDSIKFLHHFVHSGSPYWHQVLYTVEPCLRVHYHIQVSSCHVLLCWIGLSYFPVSELE